MLRNRSKHTRPGRTGKEGQCTKYAVLHVEDKMTCRLHSLFFLFVASAHSAVLFLFRPGTLSWQPALAVVAVYYYNMYTSTQ